MEEDVIKIKEKIKKELNADLYEEVSEMFNRLLNQYRDLDRTFQREHKLLEDKNDKLEKEINDKYSEKRQKEKWLQYYDELCVKYAKLEIELDITKTKVKLLEKK